MAQGFQRILLVVPPFYRLMEGRNNWIHLGLAYLAATLHKHGHQVRVYNADYGTRDRDISLRETFEAYQGYKARVNNPADPIWREIRERIRDYHPDLVGVTVVFSATLKSVRNICQMVKEDLSGTKVAVGGPHCTLAPEETLSHRSIDYLVRGEGENTLLDLVQGEDPAKIAGLSYKVNGDIRHNPDRPFIQNLDGLPFPDLNLQLIPIEDPRENFGVIATGRGCPRRCVFCSSPRLWGKVTRHRSVPNMLEEMSRRYHQYGVKKYYFSDDSFNLHKEYAKDLCRGIIASGMQIEFICEANIGVFDRELMELMKQAGCQRLKFGMEAGTDRVLKLMKKGTTVSQVRETCALAREAGIDYTLYVMIGMPTETIEEMRSTLELAREMDPKYVSLSVAIPHIGTELYQMAKEMGVEIPVDAWERFYHQSNSTPLNPAVNESLIGEFLTLNEAPQKLRTI